MGWYDDTIGAVIGGANDAMFPDASEEAMKYLEQNPDIYHQYYDPYIQGTQQYQGILNDEYAALLSNPASVQALLGSGYEQSPGYQYQYDTAMNAGNSQLAAGGMLGTPSAQTQMMGTAQGLANQDYWNYYGANQSLYNQGLQGSQGMYDTGYNASMGLSGNLAGNNSSKANLAYAGQANQNNAISGLIGGITGMMKK